MNKTLHTKWGTANVGAKGYYFISSGKEGNNQKKLHRLIYEDFYGDVPSNYIIHHKNGNKLDNCILNLQIMSKFEHDNLNNSTGFYRVSTFKDKNYKLGFRWRYIYWLNGHSEKLTASTLPSLKKKVLEKGWDWFILDEKNAKSICKEYGYDIMELT